MTAICLRQGANLEASAARLTWSPTFVEGRSGRVFALCFEPSGFSRSAVVIVPPFAEEMNRTRRVLSVLSRVLASKGLRVLLMDLSGTGDSAGCFSSARWEAWREDVATIAGWLRDRGSAQLSILGLRLGACLALDAVTTAVPSVERLVLWQPVLTGESYLRQFLRIRVAAQMSQTGSTPREDTEGLMSRLSNGETVEVAGYPLSPALAAAIRNLRIIEIGTHCPPTKINWLEIVRPGRKEPRVAAREIADHWQNAGHDVSVRVVEGQAFWDLEQLDGCPAIVGATADLW